MIFESTYPENLKRLKKTIEIDYICIEEYETTNTLVLIDKIRKLSVKYGKTYSEINFYRRNVETDEYGHKEHRLVFYYENTETDEEYNERIETYQVKDLKDTISEIGRFGGCIRQKEQLKDLYTKLVSKYKGLKNDLLEEFFNTESEEEKIQRAFKRGYNKGKKEMDELKKKLEEFLIYK